MSDYATYAMTWAHSDKTIIGERKLFHRNDKWVLLEKSDDGFVEMGTYSGKQRSIVVKEIEAYNDELYQQRNSQREKIEAIRESVMLYETDGRHDTRHSGDVGGQLVSDERVGSLYRRESDGNRSTSDEGSKHDNWSELKSKYSSPEEAKTSGEISDAKFSIKFADDIANKQRKYEADGLSNEHGDPCNSAGGEREQDRCDQNTCSDEGVIRREGE